MHTKSTYANVRTQIYVRDKVRMSKVRTQMFICKFTFAKVRTVKCTYAKVRMQMFVSKCT